MAVKLGEKTHFMPAGNLAVELPPALRDQGRA